MSPTLRGTLLPQLQNEGWDFDPAHGFVYDSNWRGMSRVQMLAKQQDYVRNGIACRLEYNQGDTATLIIHDSTQQYTIDTWQILGNEISLDLLSSPALINYIAGVGGTAIVGTIIGVMRENLSNDFDPAVLFGMGGELMGWENTIVERTYKRKLFGQTDYDRARYVLRHTTNVSNRWDVNVADNGVDSIYTPSQLISEVTNPFFWAYPLPGRLQYKISNIPAPTAQTGYLWGWLKFGSTETTAANNRIDIATEYTLEQWSTDDYAIF